MKSFATVMSLAVVLGVAACSPSTNPNRPTDTGNMAFPTPLPQGNIGSSSVNSSTVGGGIAQPSVRGQDTGNMALPSRAQGNSRPGSY